MRYIPQIPEVSKTLIFQTLHSFTKQVVVYGILPLSSVTGYIICRPSDKNLYHKCQNSDKCAGQGITPPDVTVLYVVHTAMRLLIVCIQSKTHCLSRTPEYLDIIEIDTLLPYRLLLLLRKREI